MLEVTFKQFSGAKQTRVIIFYSMPTTVSTHFVQKQLGSENYYFFFIFFLPGAYGNSNLDHPNPILEFYIFLGHSDNRQKWTQILDPPLESFIPSWILVQQLRELHLMRKKERVFRNNFLMVLIIFLFDSAFQFLSTGNQSIYH